MGPVLVRVRCVTRVLMLSLADFALNCDTYIEVYDPYQLFAIDTSSDH